MMKMRTILFPTDFSDRAEQAFPLACSLARDHGAALVILYVDPPPTSHGEVVARRQGNGYHEQLWQQLRAYQAKDLSGGVRHVLEDGEPAEGILRVARDANADLIVMGTHGRSALQRLLMGSVAVKVVREAPCPVVTVRGTWPPSPDAE
jgi:nucleotide-binding universal stress UspA family protein